MGCGMDTLKWPPALASLFGTIHLDMTLTERTEPVTLSVADKAHAVSSLKSVVVASTPCTDPPVQRRLSVAGRRLLAHLSSSVRMYNYFCLVQHSQSQSVIQHSHSRSVLQHTYSQSVRNAAGVKVSACISASFNTAEVKA